MQSISASCIHKKENHIQLQIQPLNLPPKIYPLTGTFTLARQIYPRRRSLKLATFHIKLRSYIGDQDITLFDGLSTIHELPTRRFKLISPYNK